MALTVKERNAKYKQYRHDRYFANRTQIRAEQREYYLKNRPEILVRMSAWGKSESGRQSAKKYREKNKSKTAERNKAYREAHRDELNAYLRKYRLDFPEKYKAWVENNREQLRAKHRRKHHKQMSLEGERKDAYLYKRREYGKRHYQKHPEKYYLKSMARRAKYEVAKDPIRDKFITHLKNARSVPCYWCGTITRKGKRHIDHIIPLDKDGKHDVFNLCCACPKCNLSKGSKMPEEWSPQLVLTFGSAA